VDFRLVAAEDFPLLWRWRMHPHVRRFYQKAPITLEELAAHLGPRITGEEATLCHLALHQGQAFAYLQCYRNADWPRWAALIGETAGVSIDLHIGEPEFLGRGFGRAMLGEYVRHVALPAYDESAAFIAHETTNVAALRCSVAAGFEPLREFVEEGVRMRLLRHSLT
jgi:aminoglycoside 6'-N-acetyltransferase